MKSTWLVFYWSTASAEPAHLTASIFGGTTEIMKEIIGRSLGL